MRNPLINRGSGYEGDTTFEGYEILAAPVSDRQGRVFGQLEGRPGTGTCYRSHELKLAKREESGFHKETQDLYILMQHGGGREVWRIPTFYDRGALQVHILALPERLQYALLYTIYNTGLEASRAAAANEASRYSQAFIDGRLKKSRPKQGRRTVTIEAFQAST